MKRRLALKLGAMALWVGTLATVMQAADAQDAPVRDSRIQEVPYNPNSVQTVTGVYGYVNSIEFARGERILKKAIGDSLAWQVRKFRNHVWLKPVEPNAHTDLMITTDRHVYKFDLRTSKNPADLTMMLRFRYPDEDFAGDDDDAPAPDAGMTAVSDDAQPRVVNDHYEVAGDDRGFGLQRVFDDGQFTYFLFTGRDEMPSVYAVDGHGTEVLVNTRRQGPYLVVEQQSDRFTVRDGTRVLCVRRALVSAAAPASTQITAMRGAR
ncbi:TrbG/VirB9 family P-type conjugative transfer protein [Burkholderia cepacia]|uniref:TrbG/VirB9 family P-type conjugative transfer protein n=1 Tax=Burkholderia cepacia TaxID=292 RepID=UPI002ABDF87E|nr:TrbG/VirB9 family P-type conjugative transfer protein [Burkholderia cepacia]